MKTAQVNGRHNVGKVIPGSQGEHFMIFMIEIRTL